MKRLLLSILVVSFIAPACQKGDEDPFLSLRTRKNRLTGDWKLESYVLTRDFSDTVKAEYFDDGRLVYTLSDSTTHEIGYSWSLSFDRDGKYSSDIRESYPADTAIDLKADTLNLNEEGSWKFSGGNGEPNKSLLVLLTEQVLSTRTSQGSNISITTIKHPNEGFVYRLDRLANKELWMSYKVTRSFAFAQEEEELVVTFTKQD